MQQQHLRHIHPRTLLALCLCASLSACAPIPVDDERVQKSAYQRLSTYVSATGAKTQDSSPEPTIESAATAQSQVEEQPARRVQKTSTGGVRGVAEAGENYQATDQYSGTEVDTYPEPADMTEHAEAPENKSLYGFVTNLFGGDEKKSKTGNDTSPNVRAERLAVKTDDVAPANDQQDAFTSLYGSKAKTEAAKPTNKSGYDYVQEQQETKEQSEKSGIGGLFAKVKGFFGKDSDEQDAENTDKVKIVGYQEPIEDSIEPAVASSDPSTQERVSTASKPSVPTQAFSAANPIYITALDLSINNLSKRLKDTAFALDERSLAFLTKGALDEDTTYKFLTESQLAAHRAKSKRANTAEDNRSLFDAMKDFLPRRATAQQQGGMTNEQPKTMTLLNTLVVIKNQETGTQRAIIMMKLKDNQTGIHLTDERRTIELTTTQAQSSLAIKRAIGAQLPSMLERLAENAFASLTAPEPNSSDRSQQNFKKKRSNKVNQSVKHKDQRFAPRARVVDLSDDALAKRNKTDSAYARSVIIDHDGAKAAVGQTHEAEKKIAKKKANSAEGNRPIYRITAEEILAAADAYEASTTTDANQNSAAQAKPTPPPKFDTLAKSPAERMDRMLALQSAQTSALKQASPQTPPSNKADATPKKEATAKNTAQNPRTRSTNKTAPSARTAQRDHPPPAQQQTAYVTKQFFGIQIMRATELAFLKDALRKLSIDRQDVRIIRQKAADNRTRFVAIYGQYNTEQEAKKILDQLPEDILSEGAFVRQVAVKARRS